MNGSAHSRRTLSVALLACAAGWTWWLQGEAGASPPAPAPRPPVTEYGSMSAYLIDDNQAMAPAKQAAWRETRSHVAGSKLRTAMYTSRTLSEPLYEQKTGYYCGPTTLAMVAKYLGVGWGGTVLDQQNAAANLLGTTSDGTPWYGSDNVPSFPKSSMYPMEDALNYRLYKFGKQMWYDHQGLPDSPSSAQQIDFRDRLTFDVDQNHPEEDNQYSTPGYQIGFQPNGTWYHWWSARGYANSGETTYFNDPGSWSAGRMSHETTRGGAGTVVVALGGRGYIW